MTPWLENIITPCFCDTINLCFQDIETPLLCDTMTLWHENLITPWFYTSVLWNIRTWRHNDFVTQWFCSTIILSQKDFVSCKFHKTMILWHLYFETQWISFTLETAARIIAISRPFSFSFFSLFVIHINDQFHFLFSTLFPLLTHIKLIGILWFVGISKEFIESNKTLNIIAVSELL